MKKITLLIIALFSFALVNQINAQNGNTLAFDGIDDYVTTGGTLVNVDADMTIEAWFNTTNSTGYNSIATMESTSATVNEFFQLLTTSTGEVYLKDANDSPLILSPLLYNDGKWHHVAFVRNSVAKTVSLYIDASFITSVTYTVSASFNPDRELRFGNSEYVGGSYHLDGMLDEIYLKAFETFSSEMDTNEWRRSLFKKAIQKMDEKRELEIPDEVGHFYLLD